MNYLSQNKLKQWREENTPRECPIFEIELKDAVVDHDHDTGMVRGVIHRQANAWEGKVYNSWRRYAKNNCRLDFIQTLENLIKYLKGPGTDIFHPTGVVQLGRRFSRLKKDEQEFALKNFGVGINEINACKNTEERVKLYKNILKNL
jgi:hypothetical protein